MSSNPGQNLEGDARLIEVLARGATQSQAAIETGLSTKTIQRRMEGEDFRAAVAGVRSQMLSEVTGQLAVASAVAVQTLVTLASGAKSELVRARCARAILELSVRFRETEELSERLSKLEAAANSSHLN